MLQYDTIFSQIQYDTIFSQKISEQKIFSKDFRTNEIQYYNAADVGGDESLFGTYYFVLGDGDQKKSWIYSLRWWLLLFSKITGKITGKIALKDNSGGKKKEEKNSEGWGWDTM